MPRLDPDAGTDPDPDPDPSRITNRRRLRSEVNMALECQPHEEGPALDGDGFCIFDFSSLSRLVPSAWINDIFDLSFTLRGSVSDGWGESVRAVSSIELHRFVERKVLQLDP